MKPNWILVTGVWVTLGLMPVYAGGNGTAGDPACKNNYALVSIEHRPQSVGRHLMRLADDMNLTEQQRKSASALFARVPEEIHAQRNKVQNLEREIARRFVEDGDTPTQLSEEIDRLQQKKRKLTEKEIEVFNQVRAILDESQYRRVMHASNWQYPE